MTVEILVEELENLCRKLCRTSDPIEKSELNAEIEHLAWLIEEEEGRV